MDTQRHGPQRLRCIVDKETVEQFWGKIDKSGPVPAHRPELGPCWVWTADRLNRYGVFSLDSKLYYAHRASWEIRNGAIPGGLCVLHKCDNQPCVRPSHLFLGTQVDNYADMMAKGRSRFGSCGAENYAAKMNEIEVRAVRKLYQAGIQQRILASALGVSAAAISRACSRKRWGHVK